VSDFSWPLLVNGAALLVAAWFVVHKLEFSPTKLIKVIAHEMRLVAGLKWTRGSVNGLAIIVIGLILMLYFFFDRTRQIIEFVHNTHGATSNGHYELSVCVFFLVVFALLSARSLPER
jgi:hypothetical protein